MSSIVNELISTMHEFRKWHTEHMPEIEVSFSTNWEFSPQTEAGMLFKKIENLMWDHHQEALDFLQQCSALDFSIIAHQGVLPYDREFQAAVIEMAEKHKREDKSFPLQEIIESILVYGEHTEALLRARNEKNISSLGDPETA